MKASKPEIIRLLLVDDHQMVRDGIKVMLESHSKAYTFKITEAASGEAALKIVLQKDFDIVLIDYQLPKMSGVDTVEKIIQYKSHMKILVLSNYDEVSYITNMLTAGAKGYILKNIEPAQLITAITSILNNSPYYSNEVALKLLEQERNKPTITDTAGLSKRELVVLKMIAQEMKNEEIAKNLNLARRTIDTHRQNIINKLNVRNTAGLVKAAIKLKLI
jgi:DNA-binding NarL/FixJ family response regulator